LFDSVEIQTLSGQKLEFLCIIDITGILYVLWLALFVQIVDSVLELYFVLGALLFFAQVLVVAFHIGNGVEGGCPSLPDRRTHRPHGSLRGVLLVVDALVHFRLVVDLNANLRRLLPAPGTLVAFPVIGSHPNMCTCLALRPKDIVRQILTWDVFLIHHTRLFGPLPLIKRTLGGDLVLPIGQTMSIAYVEDCLVERI